jgi:hypothetical protein
MAALPIPADVLAVFHHFRTAEFTTIAKDGTPITWPVTVLYQEDSGAFVTATSIGLPNKAFNIRRNARVALLFSEPKASGLSSPPAVLVQGDAQVADAVTTLEGIEALWEKIYRFQPPARLVSTSPLGRYLMDWYYMRLRIVTVPRRIWWWAEGDFSRQPEVVDHVG